MCFSNGEDLRYAGLCSDVFRATENLRETPYETFKEGQSYAVLFDLIRVFLSKLWKSRSETKLKRSSGVLYSI